MWKGIYSAAVLTTAIAAFSGCAGMADSMSALANIGVTKEEKSTFDGSTTVSMSPAWLYRDEKETVANTVKLGARWNSKTPNHVGLVLKHSSDIAYGGGNAYLNLLGADINIDGRITMHDASGPTSHESSGYNTVSHTIYTDSQNTIVVPFELLERMMAAKDCRLRIRTSKGYEEAHFSLERGAGGQGTAILFLREFMNRVKQFQALSQK